MSYLHANFEQNRLINTIDTKLVIGLVRLESLKPGFVDSRFESLISGFVDLKGVMSEVSE